MRTTDADIARIMRAIESGFEPFRCVVEIFDYDKKLRFRVFDQNDHTLLTFPSEPICSLLDKSALNALILAGRSKIERSGQRLGEWHAV